MKHLELAIQFGAPQVAPAFSLSSRRRLWGSLFELLATLGDEPLVLSLVRVLPRETGERGGGEAERGEGGVQLLELTVPPRERVREPTDRDAHVEEPGPAIDGSAAGKRRVAVRDG